MVKVRKTNCAYHSSTTCPSHPTTRTLWRPLQSSAGWGSTTWRCTRLPCSPSPSSRYSPATAWFWTSHFTREQYLIDFLFVKGEFTKIRVNAVQNGPRPLTKLGEGQALNIFRASREHLWPTPSRTDMYAPVHLTKKNIFLYQLDYS